MKKKKDEKPYIFRVSTKPDISSYKWIGKEVSLLSTISLWFIWLCRVFSLYQHIKAGYRKAGKLLEQVNKHRKTKLGTLIIKILCKLFRKNFTENQSGRSDIPPMLGEIYFILWTTLFALGHIFGWDSLAIKIAAVYYLFESSLWIFYYTVFRRFFELGYSIFHKLEYLTAMFLIIPTQALCFAHLYGKTFREMLSGLLGAAADTTPFPVTILGCLFSAIVISMIISTFPMEVIKKKDSRPNMFIIGCGDVVTERLYPAIKECTFANDINVFDLKETENEYCTNLESSDEICSMIDISLTENDIIWIETPSNEHISYLNRFIDSKAKLIVLEKPITVKRDELQTVEELIKDSEKRNKIFFLSYYALEKALPLYYLTHLNKNHEKYLDIDDAVLVNNWRFSLGALKSTKIHICEGDDNRDWVYREENGGQLLETFLHNVLIATLLCGKPQNWTDVKYDEVMGDNNVCEISLTAKSGRTDIDLYLKKNAAENELCRYAEFTFANGNITVDFDAKSAKIYFDELDEYATVSVKEEFNTRYSVLVDMVSQVAKGECKSSDIDGLINQIPTIKWLIDVKSKLK